MLDAYTAILEYDGPDASEAYLFHPASGDASRPMESTAWTQFVRRLFGRLAGTQIAPKTLRSVRAEELELAHHRANPPLHARPAHACSSRARAADLHHLAARDH